MQDNKKRYFSCNDLSLDVLAKVLLSEMKIRAWKIEGRKKSAHYVYNTVAAYRLFRDHAGDAGMKKTALELLENAFGRKGTHYNFLPQRPQVPISTEMQTASGLMIGRVKGPLKQQYLSPVDQLFKGDLLRFGYEDEAWHRTYRVTKSVPKKGRLVLKFPPKNAPKTGTPVFLLDRTEKELEDFLKALERDLGKIPLESFPQSNFKPIFLKKKIAASGKRKERVMEQHVERNIGKGRRTETSGYWLSAENVAGLPKKGVAFGWCWLPPVIWPDDEKEIGNLIETVLRKGGTRFVLNAPWQTVFFSGKKEIVLWAGPFCNLSNPIAVAAAASMGFSGAIVSPELGEHDYSSLSRQSPLPLGIVLSGNWPICISRTLAADMKIRTSFASPRNEEAWVEEYGSLYWMFPNWKLDLTDHKEMLLKAGYRFFVHLSEPVPKGVRLKKRQGLWNWKVGLQ
jgi:putative protease